MKYPRAVRQLLDEMPELTPRLDSFFPPHWDSHVALALRMLSDQSSVKGVVMSVRRIANRDGQLEIEVDTAAGFQAQVDEIVRFANGEIARESLYTPAAINRFFDDHPEFPQPYIASHYPKGWVPEILRVLVDLVALQAESGVNINLVQIKSKFAALRIYLDIDEQSVVPMEVVEDLPTHLGFRSSAVVGNVRDCAHKIVDRAAAACSRKCTDCGEPATLRGSGWVRLLCDRHHDECSDASDMD